MLFVHHLKYYKFYLKKRKKRKKNIHDIWKIRRVSGKGGKSWFMDHRLSRDVVDLASFRAKGRSPFLTLRGVFPLCTPVSSRGAKGWWRQEGQQCCQTPSISVSTFLSSSPHLFLPAFSTVWFLFLSRTRVSYTRSPRTPPLFFLSLRPYSKCFPSKPTPFFPSKYPRRVFHSSRFFFSRNNRRNTHPHCSQFLFRVMRQPFLFIPFSPLSTFRSFFLSFLTRRKVQAISRENKREDSALVRKGESKEEALGE